jgi:hypothetical protein
MRRNELPEEFVVDEKTTRIIVEDLYQKIFSFDKDDINNDEDDLWPTAYGEKCNGTQSEASLVNMPSDFTHAADYAAAITTYTSPRPPILGVKLQMLHY